MVRITSKMDMEGENGQSSGKVTEPASERKGGNGTSSGEGIGTEPPLALNMRRHHRARGLF